MDSKQATNILGHLEKQNEMLMDAYRSMFHELQNLQEEEKELRHKFCEAMTTRPSTEKKDENALVETTEPGNQVHNFDMMIE